MSSLNLKHPLVIGNTATHFSTNAEFDKTSLQSEIYDFAVDYKGTDITKIYDIHRYLMKKHNI